ncbi:DUF6615 family protein [Vreelandella sp.]|uniref:DUF6615 family protein n=1 Tax=Vreelandella sp. TaxID=3137778 RepID=UPI003BA928AF
MSTYQQSFDLLRRLAKDTFLRMQYGYELDCVQSEETITDINLLDIKKENLYFFRVDKTNKIEEKEKGIDWEFWIGSNGIGWHRYAVQAKRLYLESGKYDRLRHKHKGASHFQIDILENYSKATGAIPLYCFYNAVDEKMLKKHWHCNHPKELEQLGCTLVPLKIVKKAHKAYAPKTFEALHQHKSAKPWQCLLCPASFLQEDMMPPGGLLPEGQVKKYERLPQHLEYFREVGTLRDLPEDLYSSELRGYPKRIMVLDVGFE